MDSRIDRERVGLVDKNTSNTPNSDSNPVLPVISDTLYCKLMPLNFRPCLPSDATATHPHYPPPKNNDSPKLRYLLNEFFSGGLEGGEIPRHPETILKGQNSDLPLALEPNWEQYEWIQNSYSPVELFEMLFDNEIIKLIANCSNNFFFSEKFFYFLGILLLGEYCNGPRDNYVLSLKMQMYQLMKQWSHIKIVMVLNNTSLVSQFILVTKCGVLVAQLVIYSSSRSRPTPPKHLVLQGECEDEEVLTDDHDHHQKFEKIVCVYTHIDGFKRVIVKSMTQVRCGECHKNTNIVSLFQGMKPFNLLSREAVQPEGRCNEDLCRTQSYIRKLEVQRFRAGHSRTLILRHLYSENLNHYLQEGEHAQFLATIPDLIVRHDYHDKILPMKVGLCIKLVVIESRVLVTSTAHLFPFLPQVDRPITHVRPFYMSFYLCLCGQERESIQSEDDDRLLILLYIKTHVSGIMVQGITFVLDWPAEDEEMGNRIPVGSTDDTLTRELGVSRKILAHPPDNTQGDNTARTRRRVVVKFSFYSTLENTGESGSACVVTKWNRGESSCLSTG
uniref:(California timema) hypothetical protein n=1 Tax=Timema californicum TaxID=61474 RepID=A0A7R9IW98_TIMCA|nr:unnamed protein product [Timema californicum]